MSITEIFEFVERLIERCLENNSRAKVRRRMERFGIREELALRSLMRSEGKTRREINAGIRTLRDEFDKAKPTERLSFVNYCCPMED